MNIQAMRDELAERIRHLRRISRLYGSPNPFKVGYYDGKHYGRIDETRNAILLIQLHTRPERFEKGEE